VVVKSLAGDVQALAPYSYHECVMVVPFRVINAVIGPDSSTSPHPPFIHRSATCHTRARWHRPVGIRDRRSVAAIRSVRAVPATVARGGSDLIQIGMDGAGGRDR
jgi:hypothetical protein